MNAMMVALHTATDHPLLVMAKAFSQPSINEPIGKVKEYRSQLFTPIKLCN